mmetsp:Transcript_128983/g.251182  ORF Transcript_128983/g.251182 Transcript_128983/m.251182 type:complete len:95 (-) Transcript_128983:14-298(-)
MRCCCATLLSMLGNFRAGLNLNSFFHERLEQVIGARVVRFFCHLYGRLLRKQKRELSTTGLVQYIIRQPHSWAVDHAKVVSMQWVIISWGTPDV